MTQSISFQILQNCRLNDSNVVLRKVSCKKVHHVYHDGVDKYEHEPQMTDCEREKCSSIEITVRWENLEERTIKNKQERSETKPK